MTDQLPFDAIVLPPSWAPGHSRAIAALESKAVHAAETALGHARG
jgi:hypothetical protein